ncbi:MAG: TetR/AcrR family transcriptional regulator [Candidatus Baltobacteraceae bacterium]
MPKLWNRTIEAHKREVRDAILETTAGLLADHGVRSLTMSQIAELSGIGRATLYKYFPDVESILVAGHERHVRRHLEELEKLRDSGRSPLECLHAVFTHYALIQYNAQHTELFAQLHRDEHVGHARAHLTNLIHDLLVAGVSSEDVRDDVKPQELAMYCLSALAAAANLSSEAAVRRLVGVTLDGVRRTR